MYTKMTSPKKGFATSPNKKTQARDWEMPHKSEKRTNKITRLERSILFINTGWRTDGGRRRLAGRRGRRQRGIREGMKGRV